MINKPTTKRFVLIINGAVLKFLEAEENKTTQRWNLTETKTDRVRDDIIFLIFFLFATETKYNYNTMKKINNTNQYTRRQ